MSTITITFSSQVENHANNQQIGELEDVGEGFNLEELEKCKNIIDSKYKTELINLNEALNTTGLENIAEQAYILVIRNGVDYLLNINTKETKDNLLEEQQRKESQRKEVQAAINQFLAKGRQIEILPPQQVHTRSVVGGEQWSDYENVDDVLPFNSR